MYIEGKKDQHLIKIIYNGLFFEYLPHVKFKP